MAEGRSLFQVAYYIVLFPGIVPVAHRARDQPARRRPARRARPAPRAAHVAHARGCLRRHRRRRRRPQRPSRCSTSTICGPSSSPATAWCARSTASRFTSSPGETLAIVGESGCGKSVTALSILRLIAVAAGPHRRRRDPLRRARSARRSAKPRCAQVRGNEISMIFQEPMTSLNPVLTIGRQIGETLTLHQGLDRKAALAARGRDAAPRAHPRGRAPHRANTRTSSRAACGSA